MDEGPDASEVPWMGLPQSLYLYGHADGVRTSSDCRSLRGRRSEAGNPQELDRGDCGALLGGEEIPKRYPGIELLESVVMRIIFTVCF